MADVPFLPELMDQVARAIFSLSGTEKARRRGFDVAVSSPLTATMTDNPTSERVDLALALDGTTLASTLAGNGLGASAGVLAVNVDGTTIAISGDTLGIVAGLLPPVGSVLEYDGVSLPTGYLWADASSQLRASYPNLFAALTQTKGTFTVTIASPGVLTCTAHGLTDGDAVYLTTTGALPTGLAANTTYYAKVITADTLQLSSSRNATTGAAGNGINTSGSQSGTHTLVWAPHGVADSTHFYLPDRRGRTGLSLDNMGGTDAGRLSMANTLGGTGGEERHTLTAAEMPSHSHTLYGNNTTGTGSSAYGEAVMTVASGSNNKTSGPAGSGGAHNNMPPYILTRHIIKT